MDFVGKLYKCDRVIWIIILFLCLISIVEVYSASSTLTYKSGNHWGPITQHIIILTVGVVVVLLVHNINYKWYQVLPIFLVPFSAILLAVVSLLGAMTNGAARWMNIFGIQFQPSEIAKMAVVIATALILSKMQEEDGANRKAFKYIMWITAVICLLIAPENLSTAALLFGVVVLMMFIGRVPFGQLGKMIGILVLAGALGAGTLVAIPSDTLHNTPGLHRLETWQNRFKNFFENKDAVPPEKFDIDKDAQIAHANIAIATSHVVGKMPGNSIQRDFLSQAFSDFIFAIIIEELGLIGGAFVVFLYICLLVRAGKIAKKAKGNFATFLVMGIGLILVTQAILNMCVAVGLFPVTGQPLPLISKGGTSTLINCVYIGMILSVSRYTLEQEEKEKLAGEALIQDEPTAESLQDEVIIE